MKDCETYNKLVQLTLAGEDEAYGEIYQRTSPAVHRTVRFLIGNAAEAEDLVQEIYIQAYRSLDRFDAKRDFVPWLMGVAMRQIRNYRRRTFSQLRALSKAGRFESGVVPDFSADVVSRLAHLGLLERVDRLSFKLRQVVVLYYLNEYTQEEIAVILQIPLGTVKSRLHTALNKLRRMEECLPASGREKEAGTG